MEMTHHCFVFPSLQTYSRLVSLPEKSCQCAAAAAAAAAAGSPTQSTEPGKIHGACCSTCP